MIKKTRVYLISFLGTVCMALQAMALTVQKADIVEVDGTSVLELQFDGPFQPEPDNEDGETILIEFPEDTKWKPQKSKTSNLGLSYNYIRYQDGSGDLVIKKDQRLTMGNLVQRNMDHYEIPFFAKNHPAPLPPGPEDTSFPEPGMASPPPLPRNTGPLTITRLRVGKKNNGTRFVMDLSRQTKFIVKENSNFTKFYITPAESAQWIPALSSTQGFGLFKGYRIVNMNGDVSVEVSIEKGARVSRAQILGEQIGKPKLVIDLRPKDAPIPKPTNAPLPPISKKKR